MMTFIALEDELSEWDIDSLKAQHVDFAVYKYSGGSYDGWGPMLLRRNEEWFIHDMGHCSCFGPLENLHFDGAFKSLSEVESHFAHPDSLADYTPLIERAREVTTAQ